MNCFILTRNKPLDWFLNNRRFDLFQPESLIRVSLRIPLAYTSPCIQCSTVLVVQWCVRWSLTLWRWWIPQGIYSCYLYTISKCSSAPLNRLPVISVVLLVLFYLSSEGIKSVQSLANLHGSSCKYHFSGYHRPVSCKLILRNSFYWRWVLTVRFAAIILTCWFYEDYLQLQHWACLDTRLPWYVTLILYIL